MIVLEATPQANLAPSIAAAIFTAVVLLLGLNALWGKHIRRKYSTLRTASASAAASPSIAAPVIQQPVPSLAGNGDTVVVWKAPTPKPAAPANVLTMPAEQRQSVALFVPPGGGKTTLQNAMLLADLEKPGRDGASQQVIVLNPHFSYYHPDEQKINLHPVKHLFTVYTEMAEIQRVLEALLVIVEHRRKLFLSMPDPASGLPMPSLGHTIILLIDEWPDIAGSDEPSGVAKSSRTQYARGEYCSVLLVRVLRLARKYGVYVVLASQDGLTETLKMNGGARSVFTTRIAGRGTDETTWRALMADRPMPKAGELTPGTFEVSGPVNGRFTCPMPSDAHIARVGRLPAPQFTDVFTQADALAPAKAIPVDTAPTFADWPEVDRTQSGGILDPMTDDEKLAAVSWFADEAKPSSRGFARWLYARRGGPRQDYDGAGQFWQIVTKDFYKEEFKGE